MSLYLKIIFISVDNNQMLYRVLHWSDLESSGSLGKPYSDSCYFGDIFWTQYDYLLILLNVCP